MFDPKKAAQLDCGQCTPQLQALRNCTGKSRTQAKIELNGKIYGRCPRAIFLENFPARYFVSMYFDCRDHKLLPAPGGPGQQTAFAMELFDFLDKEVAAIKAKRAKAES